MLLEIIVNEMKQNKRWTAGGLSGIALILGFQQPRAADQSGICVHLTACRHHDTVMPTIVHAAMSSYFRECNPDDMVITASRFKRVLGPMLEQLKENRLLDEHGRPVAARNLVDEIIDHLSKAIMFCTQLLIDEDFPNHTRSIIDSVHR